MTIFDNSLTLLSDLLAGTYNATTLETYLGTASNLASYRLIVNNPVMFKLLLPVSSIRTTIYGSAISRGEIAISDSATKEIVKNTDAILDLFNTASILALYTGTMANSDRLSSHVTKTYSKLRRYLITATGTFTMPTNAIRSTILLLGGGGAGGGSTVGVSDGGYSGGGGGGIRWKEYTNYYDIPRGLLSFTIGSGGVGSGGTSTFSTGNGVGANGGTSSVETYIETLSAIGGFSGNNGATGGGSTTGSSLTSLNLGNSFWQFGTGSVQGGSGGLGSDVANGSNGTGAGGGVGGGLGATASTYASTGTFYGAGAGGTSFIHPYAPNDGDANTGTGGTGTLGYTGATVGRGGSGLAVVYTIES